MSTSLTSPRAVLGFGVLAVTSSSFIITFAEDQIGNYDPYILALTRVFWTGLISSLVLGNYGKTDTQINSKDVIKIFIAGFSLATHFGWWFASLYFDIPIGISLSLTNTAPIWLAILVLIVYKIKPTKNQYVAIMMVISGSVILFMENSDISNNSQKGLILALASAVGFAIYLLLAREMVPKLGLWRYFGLVNIVSAFILLSWIFLRGDGSLIPQIQNWTWGLALALIPGICGHAVYNYAMAKVPPVDVGIATLGEPILGTLFAWIIFHETLSIYQITGISFLIFAIGITLDLKKQNNNVNNATLVSVD
ncbi:MAG: DMT family transporter [Candidatus Kariarchaeaceae archaeon]|jgi:drug/metabolite transporter (DMT)-like permease